MSTPDLTTNDLTQRSIYYLTATRSKLLRGSVLTRYSTQKERDQWRAQADEITAELNRRKENK